MNIEITKPTVVDVRYIRAELGVRYWEDATVNGVDEDDESPTIPFVTNHNTTWDILIDIDEGKIVNWPQGTTAETHYKVCDAGVYHLLDAHMQPVLPKNGDIYVPSILCPEGNGYGDYVIMHISEDGSIRNFDKGKLKEMVRRMQDND